MKKACLRLSLISFLFALFLSLSANASPEYVQFVIRSGSMRPTFEVGDVITVQTDLNASQIHAAPYPDGDIIVIHPPTQPDAIYVRRAIQKSYVNGTYYFQTKGDANPVPDPWEIPEENIIGKVIAYSRTYTAGIWNDIAYPYLMEQIRETKDLNMAIIHTFLKILAEYPDTFITRKVGIGKTREVSSRAEEILKLGGLETSRGKERLHKFDLELRKSSNLLNPGTTADIIAAALALSILSGYRP